MRKQPFFQRMMKMMFIFIMGVVQVAGADVRLPKVFGSHMVFQQEQPLAVWGWAQPSEMIEVQLAAHHEPVKANGRGEWKVMLPALKAGGPYSLKIIGSTTVEYEDVMIGEVWLCSGQSNMEMGIGMCQDSQKEIAAANHPQIRLLKVLKSWKPEPQKVFEGDWKACSSETVTQGGWNGFSAAAYFFGRELNQKLGVTVGLIDATWGGTRIESWTPPEGFGAVPALKSEYDLVQLGDPHAAAYQKRLQATIDETEQWLSDARKALNDQGLVPPMPTYPNELLPPHNLQNATALYNGMIRPLCPFAIRGVIWYQGESNRGEGALYTERMKALIGGWRQIWGEGDFPFYYVQIAPYKYGWGLEPEITGQFWEAQTMAQAITNTGMIVINDIGNPDNIHPTNKQEVGRRLALLALAKTYGQNGLVYSGPTFKSMKIEGAKIGVTFDHVGSGLVSRDGKPLNWFEMIDEKDGGFVKADAEIDGSTVWLSAPGVKRPVAMRFAWGMLAEPNLMNVEGLPAGAFRAGVMPQGDALAMNVPEARDYQLVYDLDLAKLGRNIHYEGDNRAKIKSPFDRVAYFLELQEAGKNAQFVYVSMDAFTEDVNKIGVPTFESRASFQQNVTNLNVYSNVKGVITGMGLAGGNIEFWPNSYVRANSAKVPNASSDLFDFGDQATEPIDGYGSMQVHNHVANQTLFALNDWRKGNEADLGIGNQLSGNPDWTSAANAKSYQVKRLRVLVHYK